MKTVLFRLNFYLYLCLLPFTAYAGPEPVPIPSPTPVTITEQSLITFFQGNESKSLTFAAYPSYAPQLKNGAWGAGVAIGYPTTDYTFVALRGEFLDGNYFAASAAGGLKGHVQLFGHDFSIAGYGGVVSPLSGAGDKTTDVSALLGTMVSTTIHEWKAGDTKISFSAFGAVETWVPLYEGIQIVHAGVMATIPW